MLDHLEQEKPKIFKIYFTHMEPKPLGENDIWVNDVTELKRIMYCIGNDSNIIFDEQMKKIYPDVFSMYSSGEVHTLLEDLKCGYKEPDTAVDILKKIPVPMQIPDNMGNNPQAIEKNMFIRIIQKMCLFQFPNKSAICFIFRVFLRFLKSRQTMNPITSMELKFLKLQGRLPLLQWLLTVFRLMPSTY